ncbi:MAG: hypothetical protein FWE29_03695 [Defluviitaleaceae bacterium]|nr:hypothetical protein [Defluviitaleaceae bacterium]
MSDTGMWFDVQQRMEAHEATGSTANPASRPRTEGNEMGRDAFLRLLITQLQFQDPLSPMEDRDFIAQLAQFSALEEMQNMTRMLGQSKAFSMVGNIVHARHFNEAANRTDEILGVVTSVALRNGVPFLEIDGDRTVPLSAVQEVLGSQNDMLLRMLQNNLNHLQNVALIGRYIQALVPGTDGRQPEFIEGQVDQVMQDANGNTILMVNGREVFAAEVISVADRNLLIGKTISFMHGTERIEGPIQGVVIQDDRAYLRVNGINVHIERINQATDAIRLIETTITHRGNEYTIVGVMIRNGAPILIADDETEIPFREFRGIREDD